MSGGSFQMFFKSETFLGKVKENMNRNKFHSPFQLWNAEIHYYEER